MIHVYSSIILPGTVVFVQIRDIRMVIRPHAERNRDGSPGFYIGFEALRDGGIPDMLGFCGVCGLWAYALDVQYHTHPKRARGKRKQRA